jgi:hypothetical protein
MRKKTNRKIYKFRKSVSTKSIRFKKIFSLLVKLHRFYCLITSPLHVLPDFYILGGQKCGTSSLYDYLTTHPSIEPCYTKEPSYFDRYFERGLHWYKVNFPFKIHKFIATNILKNKFITGEASVRYLDHPFAPQRIKEITPNAKFIILLRNPIDRAHSHYTMIYRRNSESSSFVDAIENEKERITEPFNKMLNDSNYYSDIYFRHAYLHRGIYVDKIKRWMEVFPKEQFLIIQSEEFFKNPSKIYNDVLEFLGLPSYDLKEYDAIRKQQKSILEKHTRDKLQHYFKPHNDKLYELLGKKFDWETELENTEN